VKNFRGLLFFCRKLYNGRQDDGQNKMMKATINTETNLEERCRKQKQLAEEFVINLSLQAEKHRKRMNRN